MYILHIYIYDISHDVNNILINSSWKLAWVSQDQGDFGFEDSNKYIMMSTMRLRPRIKENIPEER